MLEVRVQPQASRPDAVDVEIALLHHHVELAGVEQRLGISALLTNLDQLREVSARDRRSPTLVEVEPALRHELPGQRLQSRELALVGGGQAFAPRDLPAARWCLEGRVARAEQQLCTGVAAVIAARGTELTHEPGSAGDERYPSPLELGDH